MESQACAAVRRCYALREGGREQTSPLRERRAQTSPPEVRLSHYQPPRCMISRLARHLGVALAAGAKLAAGRPKRSTVWKLSIDT